MKIIKHILAIILGLLAAAVAYSLEYRIIEFLGNIPIIGALLYYPSDASWALTVLPPITFGFSATWIGQKIAGNAKPVSVCVFVFWLLNIVSLLSQDAFSWSEFICSLIGAGTGTLCFAEFHE